MSSFTYVKERRLGVKNEILNMLLTPASRAPSPAINADNAAGFTPPAPGRFKGKHNQALRDAETFER